MHIAMHISMHKLAAKTKEFILNVHTFVIPTNSLISLVIKQLRGMTLISQCTYLLFSGERGILYHSTSFRNSLIFKCRL